MRLNELVQVRRNESSVDSEPVVCRDLANWFVTSSGKKSDVIQEFSTTKGIAARFDGKLTEVRAAFVKTLRETSSGCKHLVNSQQLGAYLEALATQLQAPGSREGPSQANCLMLTADHVMALHVQRKRKNGVEYFSAKLYDPNDTANYRRVVKVTPEDFGDLTLHDMMSRPQLIDQYDHGSNGPLSMVAMSLDHRLQPPMDRSATTPSAKNMHLALNYGLLEELKPIIKFSMERDVAPAERFKFLQANFLHGRMTIPGFFKALGFGHFDTVKAFTEPVLASKDLTLQAKIDLLEAKDSRGTPGLYAALQSGHSNAVRVFAQEVLASNDLPTQAKIDLLAARESNGRPGLHIALEEGHSDAVKAFMQEVLASKNLPMRAKMDLLAAKNSSDVSGLHMALVLDQSDAVKVFTQEVLTSKHLPLQSKFDLLNAEAWGTPGLYMALQDGHSDSVKAFTQVVLAAKDLPLQAKIELLEAETSDGTTGLSIAFKEGHAEDVRAFTQLVLASKHLTLQAKIALFPSRGADGEPGQSSEFQESYFDADIAFAQEVMASKELTPRARIDLLATRDIAGKPGLFNAHNQLHRFTNFDSHNQTWPTES